jgi:hypothetical protein
LFITASFLPLFAILATVGLQVTNCI